MEVKEGNILEGSVVDSESLESKVYKLEVTDPVSIKFRRSKHFYKDFRKFNGIEGLDYESDRQVARKCIHLISSPRFEFPDSYNDESFKEQADRIHGFFLSNDATFAIGCRQVLDRPLFRMFQVALLLESIIDEMVKPIAKYHENPGIYRVFATIEVIESCFASDISLDLRTKWKSSLKKIIYEFKYDIKQFIHLPLAYSIIDRWIKWNNQIYNGKE